MSKNARGGRYRLALILVSLAFPCGWYAKGFYDEHSPLTEKQAFKRLKELNFLDVNGRRVGWVDLGPLGKPKEAEGRVKLDISRAEFESLIGGKK